MTVSRPALFWTMITATALLALVLLRPILLPFAVGMTLAYLLVPAVDRLERHGINRSLAALSLVLLLVTGVAAIVLLLRPAVGGALRFFIERFARTVARVQSLMADTSRPWLHKLLGEELRIEETVTKEVAAMGGAWLDDVLRSAWSGGKALL